MYEVFRIDPDHLAVLGNGLIKLALVGERRAEREMRPRVARILADLVAQSSGRGTESAAGLSSLPLFLKGTTQA
jgi:hypothetical protein